MIAALGGFETLVRAELTRQRGDSAAPARPRRRASKPRGTRAIPRVALLIALELSSTLEGTREERRRRRAQHRRSRGPRGAGAPLAAIREVP
jgi:hypothetical protein